MIKLFASIVSVLVVTQAYAVNPATQEYQELRDELIQEWTKHEERYERQKRQMERQKKYFEEHTDCKYKIIRLKHKVSGFLELAVREQNALVRQFLAEEDELADASRDALLALDGTSFDNPSKAIQEVAKKVRHSISNDGDNTVSSLLALLEMLKNKSPNNK